jgi:hypothetical protein
MPPTGHRALSRCCRVVMVERPNPQDSLSFKAMTRSAQARWQAVTNPSVHVGQHTDGEPGGHF